MVILNGNLPGEPQLESTMGATIELTADVTCSGCPLVGHTEHHDGCVSYHCRASNRPPVDDPHGKRPAWCPLDAGPVTVELRKR